MPEGTISMTTALQKTLNACMQRGRVLTSPAQLAGYDADGLGYKIFRPDAVVIPADAEELVSVLQSARELDVPVCLRGAGTSLSGGPVAAQGGVVVHTSQLRKIRDVRPAGFWCEVECGVTLDQLDTALKPHGVFYPPDPSSGPVCTIGGNVAMNAGGAHCFRHGVTGNYVLGVEAVLLDGSVHRFGGPAGGRGGWREDWKRLMVGSEGTLAAFTRFWLRLLPRPEKAWTFRATYPDLRSAERAIHALVAHAAFPVAIELMDPRCVAMVENSPMAVGLPHETYLVVTEIDGPAELVHARVEAVADLLREAGASDVAFSDDEEKRQKLWRARKVAGGLMGQLSPDMLVQDAVIPKQALADVLQMIYDEADAAGIPAVNVFHAGDGNLHPNFLFDSRKPGELERVEGISKRLMERVVEVGGTLSGEHGIGNDKSAYMPLVFDRHTLRLQLAVPAAFNPAHQLNPLKVFSSRSFRKPQTADDQSNGQPFQRGTPRLFEAFLDPIDAVLCISADATAEPIQAQAAQHGLRFPLLLDAEAPLREQVASSGFAPASSRFGSYYDNIIGMNWQLPGRRVVRIGERVVKSTTGYDLLRFLLLSQGAFGHAVDYVVRLRPQCGMTRQFEMRGEYEVLGRAIPNLVKCCWMHWFDAVELITGGAAERDGESMLRITVHSPEAESIVFETFLRSFAAKSRLTFDSSPQPAPLLDGCPDFMIKVTPDRVVPLARNLATPDVRCVALVANGVVHGYLKGTTGNVPERVRQIVQRIESGLHEIGGEWRSRHLPTMPPDPLETAWLDVLEREFAAI